MLVAQLCPTLCDPMESSPPGSSVHGVSRQEYWQEFLSTGDLPNPGIEHWSPGLQGDSLPSELNELDVEGFYKWVLHFFKKIIYAVY